MTDENIGEIASRHASEIVRRTLTITIPAGSVADMVSAIDGQQWIDRQATLCWAQLFAGYLKLVDHYGFTDARAIYDATETKVAGELATHSMARVPMVKAGLFRKVKAFTTEKELSESLCSMIRKLSVMASERIRSGSDLYESIEEAVRAWWFQTWLLNSIPAGGLTMAHARMIAEDWAVCISLD